MILEMLWLVHYNLEIDWKTGEMKMIREKTKEKKKKKPKRERTIEVMKIAEEKWKIWSEEEETVKSKEETKKLISQRFYKWIYIFGKKASERMLTKKF